MKYFLLSFILGTLLLFSITCKSFTTGSEEDSTNLIDTTKSKDTTNLTDSTVSATLPPFSFKLTNFEQPGYYLYVYYEVTNNGALGTDRFRTYFTVTCSDGNKYYYSDIEYKYLGPGKTLTIEAMLDVPKKAVSVIITDIEKI